MPKGITETTKRRKELIFDWAEQHHPVTVRQIFYRLSTLDAIPKTEQGYQAVSRLCTSMRRDGEIPYSFFLDHTRWVRRPTTHNTIQDALQDTALFYRKALWQDQAVVCEVWIEKEALTGVVFEVTSEFDVPLVPVRGYPSVTLLQVAAEQINTASRFGKKYHIFYFGDYDPSGVDIFRNISERLHEFSPQADLFISRPAVTEKQIMEMQLPSRPTKKSDTRSKGFGDESVELDAINPDKLREIVRDCIFSVLDQSALEHTLLIEKLEQESINQFVNSLALN